MDVLYWLIGGGLFYTVGCIFYFFDKYKYMHPLWHLFVLGGSVCHFISVLFVGKIKKDVQGTLFHSRDSVEEAGYIDKIIFNKQAVYCGKSLLLYPM